MRCDAKGGVPSLTGAAGDVPVRVHPPRGVCGTLCVVFVVVMVKTWASRLLARILLALFVGSTAGGGGGGGGGGVWHQAPTCFAPMPTTTPGLRRGGSSMPGAISKSLAPVGLQLLPIAVNAPRRLGVFGEAGSRRHGESFRFMTEGGGGGEEEIINVGDIVEFDIPGLVSVGLVEAESEPGVFEVVRLVRREGVGEECYLDESLPVLYIEKDRCRFVDSYPSQRVAWSTASPHHNPHGEESEDVWFLESELSPECEILTKPISET